MILNFGFYFYLFNFFFYVGGILEIVLFIYFFKSLSKYKL